MVSILYSLYLNLVLVTRDIAYDEQIRLVPRPCLQQDFTACVFGGRGGGWGGFVGLGSLLFHA